MPTTCALTAVGYLRELAEIVVVGFVVAGILSVDSLGFLPWAQSLLTKGLGAGSAMILLVAEGAALTCLRSAPVGQVMGHRTAA